MVRFPLAILPKLRKVASSFGDKPVRIRIEDGRIRVNSMSISIPGIITRQMSDRAIDIPDDAPARDILALNYLFTKEEIAESDLTARFLAANSQRIKAIDSATDTLKAFGTGSADIESLVNIALKSHANNLRRMLNLPLCRSAQTDPYRVLDSSRLFTMSGFCSAEGRSEDRREK